MFERKISVEFRLLGPFSLRREWLAEQIWPSTQTVSKQAFNTALWRLNKVLAYIPEVELQVQKDALRFEVGPQVMVDIHALEATNTISNEAETPLSPREAQQLQNAVQLWRGPFMGGANQEWILVARERTHAAYTRALCLLMRDARRGKCFAKALDYGLQILGEDPFWESVHCEVLCLLVLTGQRARARALKTHMRFCELLQKELGIGPTTETAPSRAIFAAAWSGQTRYRRTKPRPSAFMGLSAQ